MSQHDDNEPKVVKSNTPAPFTNEQLSQMLLKALSDSSKSQEKLAEAILESRKPYVDPKVLEQKRQEGEDRKRQIEIDQRQRQLTKEQCPHTRTTSDSEGNLTFTDTPNIKWMEHSNGIILGVCGTCHSQMDARIAKDRAFLLKDGTSVGNMGRARARR